MGKKSQAREAYNAQNMRAWEASELNKNIQMLKLARLANSRGIGTQVALDAVHNPTNMATLLNLTGIPTQDALKMVSGQSPATWEEYGGYAPKGALGNERSGIVNTVKGILPVAAAAAAMPFGGPAGAIGAASLTGASQRGGGNHLKGALSGAGKGALYTAAAPTFAESLGVTGSQGPLSHLVSETTGLNSPSLLSQLGVSGAPSLGGGIGLLGNAGQAGLLNGPLDKIKEAVQPFLDKANPLLNVLDKALPILDVAGNLLDPKALPKETSVKEEIEETPENERFFFQEKTRGGPKNEIEVDVPTRANRLGSPSSKLDELLRVYNALFKGKTTYPPLFLAKPVSKARGGYIHGRSGGQTDDRPIKIPEGAYVMDATTVSLLGDGNSNHGAEQLKKLEDKFLKSGISKLEDSPERSIHAMVSDGEYILAKPVVTMLGGGDNRKGAKFLDNMRKELRKDKGVKTFLPPKTKNINKYFKGVKQYATSNS